MRNVTDSDLIFQLSAVVRMNLYLADFESSIESLVASDVGFSLELSEVNNRVTNVDTTVENLDDRVLELTAELTSLGDTFSEIDSRVAKMEVAGKTIQNKNQVWRNDKLISRRGQTINHC